MRPPNEPTTTVLAIRWNNFEQPKLRLYLEHGTPKENLYTDLPEQAYL